MGKYIFMDYETKEKLATMPEGSFQEAQEEGDRLTKEYGRVVIAIKID